MIRLFLVLAVFLAFHSTANAQTLKYFRGKVHSLTLTGSGGPGSKELVVNFGDSTYVVGSNVSNGVFSAYATILATAMEKEWPVCAGVFSDRLAQVIVSVREGDCPAARRKVSKKLRK